MKKNRKGIFRLDEINRRSFLSIFFKIKQNTRMPKKTFIGAGAIAIIKGIATIAQ